MDHHHALNRLRSAEILSRALDYALFDRIHNDFFFDPIEIEYAQNQRDVVIDEIADELANPESYNPRTAIAYFPPKNSLCNRRMVYIPIKDLTVRYAIGILFSEQIENEIHENCYAVRRATGDDIRLRFTEDFATGGWHDFCQWQSQETYSADNSVLLKTDISAFYDSISHHYLIDAVSRHLGLPADSAILRLFKTLLRTPVISYSPRTGEIEGPSIIEQGLPIGDGVEGYLANIFLKDVDDAMSSVSACYGRYVDDIRIFGGSRQDVLHHLRILQEELLRKGLNLNSSKTEIAEDEGSLAAILSQTATPDYFDDNESEDAGTRLTRSIDQPLNNFNRTFTSREQLIADRDAKEFCKYMSSHNSNGYPLIRLGERRCWHVNRLIEIVQDWKGAAKHAVWLLVQTATNDRVESRARSLAKRRIVELLEDSSTNSYSKYRIMHHLLKLREDEDGDLHRFISRLTTSQRDRIDRLIPDLIAAQSFELNCIALYSLQVNQVPLVEINAIVRQSGNLRCEPLRNGLLYLEELNQ